MGDEKDSPLFLRIHQISSFLAGKAKVAFFVPTGRTGQRPGDGRMAHDEEEEEEGGGSGGRAILILWC